MAEEKVSKQLLELVPHEGLVLVVGGLGAGKSALAYALIEAMHEQEPERGAHVFGLPAERHHLLPDWLKPTDSIEFPEDSMVLADEAYIRFHARESMKAENKFADTFAGLVRQKGILGIYVTQTARKLDIGLVSGGQALLIKNLDVLQIALDRASLRSMFSEAAGEFKKLPKDERKRAVYAIAGDFKGLILDANGLPSFWSDELSRAWRGVSLGPPPDEITQETYQALFRQLAGSLIVRETLEVKRAIRMLEPAFRGEPPSPELIQALQACIPYVSQSARQIIGLVERAYDTAYVARPVSEPAAAGEPGI